LRSALAFWRSNQPGSDDNTTPAKPTLAWPTDPVLRDNRISPRNLHNGRKKHWRLKILNAFSSEVTHALTGPAMRSSTVGTRHRVIVLDDDPGMLRAVQRVLEFHGFETEVFSSVEGFVEGAHLGDATCLVLDVHLQRMSGIELRRQLTRSGHSLPVIFITAVESETTRKAALEAGCFAYLHKPFPSDLLIEAIEAIIEKDRER
jgi:CheY-like chemotaxis protein